MHNRVGIKYVPLFYESYHFSNSIALILLNNAARTSVPNGIPPRNASGDGLPRLALPSPHVVVEEALCLNMIRDTSRVPIPEVYGWRVEEDCVFIYMQLVRGESLHDRWDSLSGPGKVSIRDQLREIVVLLGQIEQEDPSDRFIGMYAIRTLSNNYLLMKYCISSFNHPSTTTRLYV